MTTEQASARAEGERPLRPCDHPALAFFILGDIKVAR
jgi:hypothetical protein